MRLAANFPKNLIDVVAGFEGGRDRLERAGFEERRRRINDVDAVDATDAELGFGLRNERGARLFERVDDRRVDRLRNRNANDAKLRR